MAVAALRKALAACGTGGAQDEYETAASDSTDDASQDGDAGSHAADDSGDWDGAAALQRRLRAAVNEVLEHGHTLLYDLPGPFSDSDSRQRIADTAMELLELSSALTEDPAEAPAADASSDLAPEVQARCDSMHQRLGQLPYLPAVLQRGTEDGLRRMCVANAALVRSSGSIHLLSSASKPCQHMMTSLYLAPATVLSINAGCSGCLLGAHFHQSRCTAGVLHSIWSGQRRPAAQH